MKNKITLANDDISNIIKIYQEETIGVEALAGRFKVGKLKIKGILNQHNIPIKKKGAQIINGDSSEIEASRVFRYTVTDDSKKMIAVCKSTNRGFDDINNVSGALTSHILSTYGDVPIPSNTYQRKKYEKEYGKKWFEYHHLT